MRFARASTASACCVHACSQGFFFSVVTGRGVIMMTGARGMNSSKVDNAQPPWQGHPRKQGSSTPRPSTNCLHVHAQDFLPTGFW